MDKSLLNQKFEELYTKNLAPKIIPLEQERIAASKISNINNLLSLLFFIGAFGGTLLLSKLYFLLLLVPAVIIFVIENKVQIISVKTASPAGFKTVNPGPIDVTEYILFYTKSKSNFKFKKSYVPVGYNKNYNLVVNKSVNVDEWTFTPIKQVVIYEAGFEDKDAYLYKDHHRRRHILFRLSFFHISARYAQRRHIGPGHDSEPAHVSAHRHGHHGAEYPHVRRGVAEARPRFYDKLYVCDGRKLGARGYFRRDKLSSD